LRLLLLLLLWLRLLRLLLQPLWLRLLRLLCLLWLRRQLEQRVDFQACHLGRNNGAALAGLHGSKGSSAAAEVVVVGVAAGCGNGSHLI
jgi:hypothetical protein